MRVCVRAHVHVRVCDATWVCKRFVWWCQWWLLSGDSVREHFAGIALAVVRKFVVWFFFCFFFMWQFLCAYQWVHGCISQQQNNSIGPQQLFTYYLPPCTSAPITSWQFASPHRQAQSSASCRKHLQNKWAFWKLCPVKTCDGQMWWLQITANNINSTLFIFCEYLW